MTGLTKDTALKKNQFSEVLLKAGILLNKTIQ